jgi:phosphotransferase system, enzyme I, PtsP
MEAASDKVAWTIVRRARKSLGRSMSPSTVPRVHAAGHKRLDRVLDFVAFSARPMPLVTLLDDAPRRIALILEAEVCSLYLLEGEGHQLVMRGNVGFPHRAVGQVRLAVGEGITGQAVEYLRPISADFATEHASYKHIDGLGEENYPAFLAVPIRGKTGPLGAVVVQRKSHPFGDADVELLAVLGGLVAAGIRHAELIDASRDKAPVRKAGGGTRRITLPGTPLVHGRALGAVAALRRPPPRPSHAAGGKEAGAADVRLLHSALDVADKAIHALTSRAKKLALGADSAFLSTYTEILGDGRFRERAEELTLTGAGLPSALSQLAREVTRSATSLTRDSFLEDRARDIEDLCDAVSMLAASDKRAELPTKGVLIGDSLSVFDLLVSSRAQPVGVALTERSTGPRTHILLRLLDVPSILDVRGLFRWASDGDLALVDADHGLLVLNPSKSDIASVRLYKRGREEAHHQAQNRPSPSALPPAND